MKQDHRDYIERRATETHPDGYRFTMQGFFKVFEGEEWTDEMQKLHESLDPHRPRHIAWGTPTEVCRGCNGAGSWKEDHGSRGSSHTICFNCEGSGKQSVIFRPATEGAKHA